MSAKVRFVRPHFLQDGATQEHVSAGDVRQLSASAAMRLVADGVATYEEMPVARQTPPAQRRPGMYGDLSRGRPGA